MEQQRVKHRTKLTGSNAVDETIDIPVYGTQLSALVRGNDRLNPLLLMVHGGPGTPDSGVGREFDNGLVEVFTVVRYDQRGTGRSRIGSVPIARYSIELFVDDLLRVARALRMRFPRRSVVLLGNSWGSVLGLLAAKQQPELFDAYVGVSQVIDLQTSDPWSYDEAMESAQALKRNDLVRKLKKLDRNRYYLDFTQVRTQRSVLFDVGGVMVNKGAKRKMSLAALRSPDFSLNDLWRTAITAKRHGQKLYPQMALTNLFDAVSELPMPVFFIEGRQDRQVSPQLAQDFLRALRAPHKRFVWVDGGHFFDFEYPDAFHNAMRDVKEELKEFLSATRPAAAVQ